MNAEERRRRAVIAPARARAAVPVIIPVTASAAALGPRTASVFAPAVAPAAAPAHVAYPTIVGPQAALAFIDDDEDYELFNLAHELLDSPDEWAHAKNGQEIVDLRKLYDVRLVLENNTELKMILKRLNREIAVIGFVDQEFGGAPLFLTDLIQYEVGNGGHNTEYVITMNSCCLLDPSRWMMIRGIKRATRVPAPRFVSLTPERFNDGLGIFQLEHRNGEVRAFKRFDDRSVIGRGSATTPNAFRLFKLRFLVRGANSYVIRIDERDYDYTSKYVVATKWEMIRPPEP